MMDYIITLSRILFMIATIIHVIRPAKPLDCSPSFPTIKCECTTANVECMGTQVDILEAEDILRNFSAVENVIFKINDLQFDPGFKLKSSSIKNLTLGYTKYGLQVLSSEFFSGFSSSLTSLNLQNNSINNIDDYFFTHLSLLTELVLDNNNVENLTSNTFNNLNNLKYLSISFNNISVIVDDVFQDLTSLENLILSHNKFQKFESINVKSISLIEMKIDNCLIEGAVHKDILGNIPNVEYLDISYNKISGIESHSLSKLNNLKFLNLSFNEIEYLAEKAFSGIVNLTSLDLQGNKISVIKISAFEKLYNLKYMNLNGNKLTAVLCEYTSDLSSLETIYLENNEIKTFTQGAFFYSPKLKILDMTGNNLECSCSLTDSALYLIENGTMDSSDLDSVSCIIASTGSMSAITKYKSSKCVPVEPCKKVDIEEEEEYEDYFEDSSLNSTIENNSTFIQLMTTDKTSEKDSTTVMLSTETTINVTETFSTVKLITTTESNESTTLFYTDKLILFDSTTFMPTTNSIINETETDISTELEITTIQYNDSTTTLNVSDSKETTVSFNETTMQLFTESISSSSSEEPNTTFTTTETSTTSILTTQTTGSFFTSISTENSKITSSVSEPDCSSLQLIISNVSVSSEMKIFKKFSNNNNLFCLKWTASNIEGLKLRCLLKYTTSGGTKVLNLKCPSYSYEIKEVSKTSKLLKFCITIEQDRNTKVKSCEQLVSTTVPTFPPRTTTSSSTISPESTTAVHSTLFDETTTQDITSIYPETTSAFDSTTIDTTSESYDTTTTLVDKITTDTTVNVFDETSAGVTFHTTLKETSTSYPTDFAITALDIFFNDSKLAFTKWAVNKIQPSHECNMTLKVSTQYFEEIEGVFPCKNYTYRLTKVKEDDTFKVCLISYHVISGKDYLCQHTLPFSKASTSKDNSMNSSLIPLICLLIFFMLIIIFLVIKNIYKKRTVSKKYDVRAEEEKYQERTKLRPQSVNEESVRFSYIAKKNHEYI